MIRAKAAVLSASVFGVALVSVTAALVAGQAVYAGNEATTPVTELFDVIVSNSIYLVGIALIGAALGFILRSTAAGIGTLVGAVFIGPNLLNLLPESVTDVFMKYLPSEAGSAITSQVANPDMLSQGAAYAVFGAWVVRPAGPGRRTGETAGCVTHADGAGLAAGRPSATRRCPRSDHSGDRVAAVLGWP